MTDLHTRNATAITCVTAGGSRRRVSDKISDIVSVKDFGAVGDGTTDDTTAFTDALDYADSLGMTVLVPLGTYLISPITRTSDARIKGMGEGSVLKWKSAEEAVEWLKFTTTTGLVLQFSDLTIDSNKAGFSDDGVTSQRRAGLFCSATAARIKISNVRFINGRTFDIRVIGQLSASGKSSLIVRDSEFSDGVESSATIRSDCVRVLDDVDLIVTGCTFSGPSDNGYGRCGIVAQQSDTVDNTYRSSFSVTNNVFRSMGFDTSDSYGSIDCYSGCDDVVVSNNTLINPLGRGICVKRDSSDVAITGNTIRGLVSSSQAASISLFGAKTPTVGQRTVVTGNTISSTDATTRGILVDGSNLTDDLPDYKSTLIAGNIIEHGYQGILLKYCKDIQIHSNLIRGGSTGIYFLSECSESASVTSNTISESSAYGIRVFDDHSSLDLDITGNVFRDMAGKAIDVDETNSIQVCGNTIQDIANGAVVINDAPVAFGTVAYNRIISCGNIGLIPSTKVVEDNNIIEDTTIDDSDREVTISSGAIAATRRWHMVDTESDATTDDLVTINGGYDGRSLMLRSVSDSRAVVVKSNAGNIRLAGGDFTMSTKDDLLELYYADSKWLEISRSQNRLGYASTSGYSNARLLERSSGEYFTVASNTAFEPGSEDFFVFCHFRVASLPGQMTIVGKDDNSTERSWALEINASNKLRVLYSFDGTTLNYLLHDEVLTTDTWYTAMMGIDRVTGEMSLRLNDRTPDTTAIASDIHAGTSSFYIGSKAGSGAFDGLICGVKIGKLDNIAAYIDEIYDVLTHGNSIGVPYSDLPSGYLTRWGVTAAYDGLEASGDITDQHGSLDGTANLTPVQGSGPAAGYLAGPTSTLAGQATWDAASLADGASESKDVSVLGVQVGDICHASLSTIVASGWDVSAIVSAADTVTVTIQNNTGGTVDLAEGTVRVVAYDMT